uniref:Uncharacterized protein n=1 Tax=Triticum urartu TaxID=4572 RepID=A0A8R7QT22_TRIUA
MDCKHAITRFVFVRLPPEKFRYLNSVLQGPLSTTIIFKNPNTEFGILIIIYQPSMQAALRMPNRNNLTVLLHAILNFPPSLPLRVDTDYCTTMGSQMHCAIQVGTSRTTKKNGFVRPLALHGSPPPSLR